MNSLSATMHIYIYIHIIVYHPCYFPLTGWQLGLELDGTTSVSILYHYQSQIYDDSD